LRAFDVGRLKSCFGVCIRNDSLQVSNALLFENFCCLMLLRLWRICASPLAITSKNYRVLVKGNTASVSMSDGEFVFDGMGVMRMRLK